MTRWGEENGREEIKKPGLLLKINPAGWQIQ